MLEKIAEFYDQEVEAAVDSLTSLIEPILIADHRRLRGCGGRGPVHADVQHHQADPIELRHRRTEMAGRRRLRAPPAPVVLGRRTARHLSWVVLLVHFDVPCLAGLQFATRGADIKGERASL